MSQQVNEVYKFSMEDELANGSTHTLVLENNAKNRLVSLPPGYSAEWIDFFTKYGTHIVKEGTVGSFKRVSYSFTSVDIKNVVQSGMTFEESLEVGVPLVFEGKIDSRVSTAEKAAYAIGHSNGYRKEYFLGSIDDWTNSVIIDSTLSSFCNWLDYDNDIRNFQKDDCLKNTEKYCIDVMKGQGYKNIGNKCQIPEDNIFECVFDSDCPGDKRCWDMKCKDPLPSSECQGHYYRSRYESGCGWSCDKYYRVVGYDNKNCWLGTTNKICWAGYNAYYYATDAPWVGGVKDFMGGKVGCEFRKANEDGQFSQVRNVPSKWGYPTISQCASSMTQDPYSDWVSG